MQHLPVRALTQQSDQRLVLGTRLAQPSEPQWDVCCAVAKPIPAPAATAPARRARLAELDSNLHCSIIGTCLTTAELRKLVPRYAPLLDRRHATDLQIHHTAVELTTADHPIVKELNKALDTRHALAIKKFRPINDEAGLKLLWQEALSNGDVPGAYWALMTHPASTFDVRTLAFGDVHMLSHLVGASNRADIRRLAALEDECERLKEQNASQQTRLHDMTARHASTVDALQQQVSALQAQLVRHAAMSADDLLEEIAHLRALVTDREQKLALHTERRNDAEQKLQAEQERGAAMQASLQQAADDAGSARLELRALEQALQQTVEGGGNASLPQLQGKCVLYVGGRPGATTVLGKLVAAAGGELLVHDGGIEDRRGMLSTMLPRAHMVVFPVDFMGHNAMHVTKQTCARHGIPCHPIRSASVASFIELMQRLYAAENIPRN
jgi:uncharacterized membrane-anchored protein YhcB (DUF1043 family)